MSAGYGVNINLIVVASAFICVASAWGALVWLWSLRRSARSQKVEERLGLHGPHDGNMRVLRLWYDGRERATAVPGQRQKRPLMARVSQQLHDAGWDVSARAAVLGAIGSAAASFLAAYVLTGRALAGFGAAATLFLVLTAYVKHRVNRRLALFETQFVDALELAARSLRAGHPLAGAFRLIAEEVDPPVGTMFQCICQQQDLGVGLEDAVRQEATYCPSSDMKLFATSVAVQLRSGGNLADMMDRLAAVIRDRIRLNRRFRVLTAQTQLSKRILIILPVFLFVLLNVLNPEYMQPLYATRPGQVLMVAAGASLLFGAWVMNRMVVLRY